ncbi:MAG: hypothetical protein ACP5R4_00555 [Armatimonadota bacterium]
MSAPQTLQERISDLMQAGAEVLKEAEDLLRKGEMRAVKLNIGRTTLWERPVALSAFGAVLLAVGAVILSKLSVHCVSSQGTES